ncbi:MAG: ComEC/Rec2 family competence protein [Acidobacteria bacterium]|nr:ComEC/Rec2 family competence protein [Acidobacteriota bacterium]
MVWHRAAQVSFHGHGSLYGGIALQAPLLLAALSFAVGIAFQWLSDLWWGIPLASVAAVFCLLSHRKFLASLLLLFSAGWYWSRFEAATYRTTQELLPRTEKTVEVFGRVVSFPVREKDRMVLQVRSQTIVEEGRMRSVACNVEVQIYSSLVEPVAYFQTPPLPGDAVRFIAELRNSDLFRNPGRATLARGLREKRVHRVAVLKSPRLFDYRSLNRARNRWLLAIREQNRLLDYWPDADPVPAFLNALVWGDRSALAESFVRRSQSVGVYHLLVVSGMHFALILGVLGWIGRRLHIPFTIRTLLIIAVTMVLLIRTPPGPSVNRAALVAGGMIVLEWCWRKGNARNLLGGAGLALLCYQPLTLFNAGFQFSFVSCIVLIQVAPPLTAALIYPQTAGIQSCWSDRFDLSATSSNRDARRMRFQLEGLMESHRWLQPVYFAALPPLKILSLMARWVVLAFLIQNETFLLSTYHGNQGPGAALLANMVMIPLTSFLVISGLLLSLSPLRLELVARLSETAVNLCYSLIDFFDSWTLPDHPHAGPMLLTLLALIVGAQMLVHDAQVQKLLVLLLLTLNLGWFLFPSRTPQTGAYFLDVAQGDCAVLMNRQGRAIIIDAGTYPSARRDRLQPSLENMFLARNVVSRALWQLGVWGVDAIFVSHLHVDHISAIGRVARNFGTETVFLPRSAGSDPLFSRFVASLPLQSQICFIGAGQVADIAGFRVEVLHPDRDFVQSALRSYTRGISSTVNYGSMVLRIQASGHTFLFAGDITSKQERKLAGQVGQVEVLKVAHHGSISSTSQPWLDELHPRIAVISVGKRNPFEHPHPLVLDRLRRAGVEVHRTDEEGYVFVPF